MASLVDRQIAYGDDVAYRTNDALAQVCLYTGQKFQNAERLGDIVHRAVFQSLDDVQFFSQSRNENYFDQLSVGA